MLKQIEHLSLVFGVIRLIKYIKNGKNEGAKRKKVAKKRTRSYGSSTIQELLTYYISTSLNVLTSIPLMAVLFRGVIGRYKGVLVLFKKLNLDLNTFGVEL
ncbi:hypothetical protein ES708_02580 [subsurface metagenome]